MIASLVRRCAQLPFLLLCTAALVSPLRGITADWPITSEGLSPDPAWHWGRLDNGLRYVVRQNALPASRIYYQLAVEVGGAHESVEERGLAHFVEHMAFNGTKHFPGETLTSEMERRGIDFGPEVSAFTFLTHTLYRIDAPGCSPADLDWVLTVLRDFADGLVFDTKQVKRERGVIAAESRDRESVGKRYDRARRRALYPFSPLSNPIEGDPTQVGAAELKKFYQKWYRPERMILVVVGDATPETLQAAVIRQFGSLPPPSTPPPVFDPGLREDPAEGTTSLVHDEQSAGIALEAVSISPFGADEQAAERRRYLSATLATQILQQRLAEVARLDPKNFSEGWARIIATTPFACETSVGLQAPTSSWQLAVRTLEHELRRSLVYTFFDSEITQAKKRILHGYEQAARLAATAPSGNLAGMVLQEALWRRVSLAPTEALAFTRQTLPGLDALTINRDWRSYWKEGRAQILGYGYFPVANGSSYIRQAYAAAEAEPLPPPTRPPAPTFAYTDFGPPGEIVRRRHEPAVDLHLLEFANGVHVTLKHTDFDANTVFLGARFGAGLQSEPPEQAGIGALASHTLLNSGVGRHPLNELRQLLSSEQLNLQFNANEGEFMFSGEAATERLELLLQLLCAYLTDPKWDAKAFESATVAHLNRLNDFSRTAEGVLGLNAFLTATHQDRRYTVVPATALSRIGLYDLRDWLEPQLKSAPLDLGLVGDFPLEETIAILARTIGAIPPRHGNAARIYPVKFAKESATHHFDMAFPCARAALEIMWPADQGRDVHQSRRLEVLSAILNNRLLRRVREDLGVAYSPAAHYWKSDTPAEEGYLIATVTTTPAALPQVTKSVLAAAHQLARQGATPQEFQDALQPILARTYTQLKDNGYWLWRIAMEAPRKPEALTWPLTRTSEFAHLQLADINTLARDILPDTKALTLTVVPPKH